MKELRAPFPYFGGKRTVAHVVWQALGDVAHYVEPFFGSGAVILNRPHAPNCETVNDADGLLANFWRAVQRDPDAVAHHADNPVNDCDLHARHLWLVGQRSSITEALMGDADWHDPKAAGWWAWGASCWIGSGWCSGDGPWVSIDGIFTDSRLTGCTGQGVSRQLPHLGGTGQGVNRKRPHLGDIGKGARLQIWFAELATRLASTRVACGDWTRVCGPSVLRSAGGITGIFFDPPYDLEMRTAVYANESDCAKDVLSWCAQHGDEPDLRIVLAGYDGEHNELTDIGWRVHEWKTAGGYARSDGRAAENSAKERLWFSPHCVEQPSRQGSLF
mgnify:CR=1 FL=1